MLSHLAPSRGHSKWRSSATVRRVRHEAQVAEALRANLRSYDLVVRWGGDEFVCGIVDPLSSEGDRRPIPTDPGRPCHAARVDHRRPRGPRRRRHACRSHLASGRGDVPRTPARTVLPHLIRIVRPWSRSTTTAGNVSCVMCPSRRRTPRRGSGAPRTRRCQRVTSRNADRCAATTRLHSPP